MQTTPAVEKCKPNRKDEHSSCCTKVVQLTVKYRFEVNNHDHRKNAQMQRKRKACRYVRNTRKGLRRLSEQTQKGYSVEGPDDNADFIDRGAPWRQYDPKLMRARSRFEGVRRPVTIGIGVYGRNLRSNKHQGQVHPYVTEVYVPIIHMMLGKDGPRQKKNRQTYNGFAN